MISQITSTQASEQASVIFPVDKLQYLDRDTAVRCQSMLGHGRTFGLWETPEHLIPCMSKTLRKIEFRHRISSFLSSTALISPRIDKIIDESILWLTRLSLLIRIGPSDLTARSISLDPSTIANRVYQFYPKLLGLGINRRVLSAFDTEYIFIGCLTETDITALSENLLIEYEFMRLTKLKGLGLWSDAPILTDSSGKTTPVRSPPDDVRSQRVSTPHPPLPDDYLAAMGPRVLWLIKDMGPNIINLVHSLTLALESGNTNNYFINRHIKQYFKNNTWLDRHGQVIDCPPFDLSHSNAGKQRLLDVTQHNPCEWPPRHWSSVQVLAVTLQNAHIWIALLVMAARIGEVATLGRDCVEVADDSQLYIKGRTYKSSIKFEGKEREWPVPDILAFVLAQQVRLVEACERLAKKLGDSTEVTDLLSGTEHLWASLGPGGSADPENKLENLARCLRTLAERIGLSGEPGGKNLHPYRLRKTVARLAGLAVDGSQKMLMLLLGHEDVVTTLGYMQSDPGFAKEIDDITRELRILRGEVLIEDMRAALREPNDLNYGGYGGGGAPVLQASVHAYEQQLHRTGDVWGVNTARELSVLLTNNGESARIISANVVCTKTSGEVGLCSKKKGPIIAGNCQIECKNHIEDKAGRRDTERVIPILIEHAQESIKNRDWLPLQRDKKQLEQELMRYDDINEKWRSQPEVIAIFNAST